MLCPGYMKEHKYLLNSLADRIDETSDHCQCRSWTCLDNVQTPMPSVGVARRVQESSILLAAFNVRWTLWRPCCRLLRQRQAQQVRRSSVRELASVENGVSLIDRLQRSFAESFIWQLARMKSKSCPCSPSRRLSCDRVTHRRVLTKFVELSPRVAVITLRCSLLWQSMLFQCTKAGREHQLGPSVDTRTCVSLRYMYVLFTPFCTLLLH